MSATFSERVVIPSIVCHISGYRKNSKMSRVIIGSNEDKYISYKDPPRIRPDMEFVKWKKEVVMWQVITKIAKIWTSPCSGFEFRRHIQELGNGDADFSIECWGWRGPASPIFWTKNSMWYNVLLAGVKLFWYLLATSIITAAYIIFLLPLYIFIQLFTQ